MDQLREWGSLGLASRIRRLLEELLRDGRRIYQALGLNFEVRWFAVFHLLSRTSALSITEIAQALDLRHPTVIQVVDEMTKRGLIRSTRDSRDGRRRHLSLTAAGRKLAVRLRPVWQAFDDAGLEIVTEGGSDFMVAMGKLEDAMQRKSMFERITSRLQQSMEDKDDVTINGNR